MDTALWGVLIGFTLGIIYKIVDELTLRRQRRRLKEDYAPRRAELDARWQEIEERYRRIVALLEDLPTARRKREGQEAANRTEGRETPDEATADNDARTPNISGELRTVSTVLADVMSDESRKAWKSEIDEYLKEYWRGEDELRRLLIRQLRDAIERIRAGESPKPSPASAEVAAAGERRRVRRSDPLQPPT